MLRSKILSLSGFCCAIVLTLSGCPSSETKCTVETCAGCCSANGVCQNGETSNACGFGAKACQVCSGGNVCRQNACQAPATGAGGGGGGPSGTGGGAAGEMDSGTPGTDAGSNEADGGTGEPDSGTPDSGTPVTDAGSGEVDSGMTGMDSGTADAGDINAQIEAIRALPSGDASVPLPLDNVIVTGLKPQVPGALLVDGGLSLTDGAGFFVQASPTGPALFVRTPLPTVPVVAPGSTVSLKVTATATLSQLRAVTGFEMLKVTGSAPLAPLVQDVSNVDFNAPDASANYESELVTVAGTVAGAGFSAAGRGYSAAPFVTAGSGLLPDAGPGLLRLRMPTTLVTSEDLTAGCTLTVDSRPLWRFNTQAQVSPFEKVDLTQVTCPAPKLLSAKAASTERVELTFDRAMAARSIAADAFTINGVAVNGSTLKSAKVGELVTTPMTPGMSYTVTALPQVTDTRDTPVAGTANSATFTVP